MKKPKKGPALPYAPLTEAEINVIRGKTLVDKMTAGDTLRLLGHIDYLHTQLDEQAEDAFGTEGWRHGLLGFDQ